MINRVVLTLVFTLSFMSYMAADLNTSLQIIPPALFAALVFCKLMWSESALKAIGSLLQPDGLLYVIFLPLLIIATSLASKSDTSYITALIIAACVLLGRLYMVMVSVREVMEAYCWSGILSISLLTVAAFSSFVKSVQTLERFTPFSFHPNLLAFLSVGYFCAMVWKFVGSNWLMKLVSATTGILCLMFILFTSSRGSMVGVVFGSLVAITLLIMRWKREGTLRLRWSILLILVCLGATFAAIRQSAWVQETSELADKALAITDPNRGVDTGFTGRFDKWQATLNILSDGSWLFGKGIRSSDLMADNFIDNSYLVILYEVGIIPLLLITWRFCSLERRSVGAYLHSARAEDQRFYLYCIMLIAAFMANNFVARFLFSIGNPYSLVALLVFVAPIDRLFSAPMLLVKVSSGPALKPYLQA